ncbi:MAG: glycerol-3-phosphate acyltransferase [Chloroflexi bacterium]|nr:glycerol-3-phosphate acyltransferase [Chloroflexota bacterium]
MDITLAIIAGMVGYLCGALSFTRIIGKFAAPNEDLSQTEFSVPGADAKVTMTSVSATSLSIRKGPKAGCPASILDMVKVAIPTLIFKLLYPDAPYFLITAAAGVVGHNWPLYYRFVGGRGISAIMGGLFVIDWLGIFIPNLLGMAIGVLVFKDVLIAYAAGTVLLIPWLWWRANGDVWHIAYAVFVSAAFLIAMLPELRQYAQAKRDGKVPSLETVLSVTDMGKGLQKMSAMFKPRTKQN